MMNVPSTWSNQKRPHVARGGRPSESDRKKSDMALLREAGVVAMTESVQDRMAGGGEHTIANSAAASSASSSSSHSRKKARSSAMEHVDPVSAHDLAQTICDSIRAGASAAEVAPSHSDALNLSTILSGVSYREILQNLFGDADSALFPEVPVVSKAYEEACLRECGPTPERPCAMGQECEGFFLSPRNRFACAEFLLPGEERTEPRMCVLCTRKHTQKLYYDLLYSPQSNHMGVIQRYGVVVGVVDEYAPEAVLTMPSTGPVASMPFPSVAYCRADYTVSMRGGVRVLEQASSMGFRPPSHRELPSA